MAAGFTWIEYQVLTLVLAAMICTALGLLEYSLRRFSILTMMFGMLTVRRRRLFCYEIDTSFSREGRAIRLHCKWILRIMVVIVFSYVWQSCVMESVTLTSGEFPIDECRRDKDCFASELSLDTFFFFKPQHAIDCSAPEAYEPEKYTVVNCLRFVQPDGKLWMEKTAIAYSMGLLLIRVCEFLIWVLSRSRFWYVFSMTIVVLYTIIFILCFLFQILGAFVSSWLGYVIMFAFPLMLCCACRAAQNLRQLRHQLYKQYQEQAQRHIRHELRNDAALIGKDLDALVRAAKGSSDGEAGAQNGGDRQLVRFDDRQLLPPPAERGVSGETFNRTNMTIHLSPSGTEGRDATVLLGNVMNDTSPDDVEDSAAPRGAREISTTTARPSTSPVAHLPPDVEEPPRNSSNDGQGADENEELLSLAGTSRPPQLEMALAPSRLLNPDDSLYSARPSNAALSLPPGRGTSFATSVADCPRESSRPRNGEKKNDDSSWWKRWMRSTPKERSLKPT